MKKLTIAQLRKVNTIADLKSLNIGELEYDMGYRGGYIGFKATDVANAVNVSTTFLPPKFGAYCNYLGGGVRGAIIASRFASCVTPKETALLDELGAACIRAYKDAENKTGLNDDSSDIPNWDARATKASRNTGIVSAY